MKTTRTTKLSRGAVIAAVYVAMCFFLKPISYGPVQLRLSEALCVLPIFMPEAVYGLFIGCFLSNLLGGASVALIDTILGSLTTLLAAHLTRRIFVKTKSWWLALMPPVILNALIVGSYVPFIYQSATQGSIFVILAYSIASVFIGETLAVYVIGLPFGKALAKTNIFKC